ncbi:MAG TPA: VOC family protein [Gemmatimonadaceae bacterium]|jgi:catechol 2,3-dioxygenase-like lactoylglutathione lyase family enzyme
MNGSGHPQLERIVETALYVDDLTRSRGFYVDLLGCEPLLDSARLLGLSVGGVSVLLLFQRGATRDPLPTPGGVVPPHGGTGIQHIAFAVPDEAHLERWATRLEDCGVEIESRVRWQRGGQSVYVRDPDGHSIEFITPGLWAIY